MADRNRDSVLAQVEQYGGLLVVDEAYAEYAAPGDFPSGREYLDEERPLLVIEPHPQFAGHVCGGEHCDDAGNIRCVL